MSDPQVGSPLPPFLGLVGPEADRTAARFVVVPIPHEATAIHRPGARFGPEAILRASLLLERYDGELNTEVHRVGIHTAPALPSDLASPSVQMTRIEESVAQVIDSGKLPVILGGEHTIVAPAVEACLAAGTAQLTVLHIGARACLRTSDRSSVHTHLCTMNLLRGKTRIVEVGIRALATEEAEVLEEGMVKAFPMHAMRRRQFGDVISEIGQAVRGSVFIALSLDGLDPSIMPATGCPEPGGLLWWEALALLRTVISQTSVIGLAVTELSPIPGLAAPDLLAARLVHKLMGYVAKYQAFWRSEETGPPPSPPPRASPPPPPKVPPPPGG